MPNPKKIKMHGLSSAPLEAAMKKEDSEVQKKMKRDFNALRQLMGHWDQLQQQEESHAGYRLRTKLLKVIQDQAQSLIRSLPARDDMTHDWFQVLTDLKSDAKSEIGHVEKAEADYGQRVLKYFDVRQDLIRLLKRQIKDLSDTRDRGVSALQKGKISVWADRMTELSRRFLEAIQAYRSPESSGVDGVKFARKTYHLPANKDTDASEFLPKINRLATDGATLMKECRSQWRALGYEWEVPTL